MNTEQFHDALTLLPEDLVAEVDALRRPQKQKVIYWKRILPTAACAAIVLLSALTLPDLLSPKGSLECADEAAPAEAAVQAPAASPPLKTENAQMDSPAEAAPDCGQGAERSMEYDEAYPLTAHYLPVQPSSTEGGSRSP